MTGSLARAITARRRNNTTNRNGRRSLAPWAAAALAAQVVTIVTFAQPAHGTTFTSGDHVLETLSACRNNGDVSLPNSSGQYVCLDSQYTTGNLGKNWAELDLVPHRLTTQRQATSSTPTYNVIVGGDYYNGGSNFGYDVITTAAINTTESDASCTVSSGTQFTQAGPTGGAITGNFRILTISQNTGTTCVVDWAQRLALGAHNYPGASLQSYKFDSADFKVGKQTISLPVNAILPQSLSKTMGAVENADYTWLLQKGAKPTTLTFANTCDTSASRTGSVQFTLSWTKQPASANGYTVTTVVTATNPASRTITIQGTDNIYAGGTTNTTTGVHTGGVLLETVTGPAIDVPANSSVTLLTHVYNVTPAQLTALGVPDANNPGFNDVATATYVDKATGIPVPGSTFAYASVANSAIGTGQVSGNSIDLSDAESITGSGLDFKVDSAPSVGSFTNYTVGDYTTGPVDWQLNGQTSSGSVTFNKTVRVTAATATSGTLSDTLTGTYGTTSTQASAHTDITASALVSLEIDKTIPVVLGANDGAETFTFNVTGPNSYSNTATITFNVGDGSPADVKSTTLTGLAPGTYQVSEQTLAPYQPQSTHSVPITLPACGNATTFTNAFGPALARVLKVTVPSGSEAGWNFYLNGPGITAPGVLGTTTGTGFVNFGGVGANLNEGTYTVTESPTASQQGAWDLTGVTSQRSQGGVDGSQVSQTGSCTFTVNYPADADAVFSCRFTNTQRGSITIIKDARPDSSQVFNYTTSGSGLSAFSLVDDGATAGANTKTFSNLVAGGVYGVTETLPVTNWDFSQVTCSSTLGTSVVVKSAANVSITLGAGDAVTCTYVNIERARVRVIKTENGGNPLHAYEFDLTGGPDNVNLQRFTDPTAGTGAETLDFGYLRPGSYTLCEMHVPAGTASTLQSVYGGVLDPTTGNICLTFTLTAGGDRDFTIDNSFPGGGQRTIGYWKNWNSCNTSGGDWVAKAAKTGNHLMDEFLPQMLGNYAVDTCAKGVAVLSAASGKYAENQLAAQLLAAELNVSAGAATCGGSINSTISQANALLVSIGYAGPPSSIIGQKSGWRNQALALATTLNNYNNGLIC